MDSPKETEKSQTSPTVSENIRSWSDDASTVFTGESPLKDVESQSCKPIDRSFNHYLGHLGLSSPVTPNVDDIDEESESDNGDVGKTPDGGFQRIDDHPNGYPRLAALMNSDENFLICRKYGFLHNRVLLYRQDELRELEQKLITLDAAGKRRDEGITLQSRVQDERHSLERKELLEEIDAKLTEYNSIVMRAREMSSLQKATTRNYSSMCNWLHNNGPLVKTEAWTFSNDKDFIALVDAKEGSWFDGRVETMLSKCGGRFTRRIFIEKRDRESTDDKLVRLYSKHRINIFSRLIITFLAITLLMAPVVALFSAQESGGIMILIIFLFTMVFSIALSLFTKAKRHEVFASSAAYCAVLVVFLGNFS